jgi:hypothetical protein
MTSPDIAALASKLTEAQRRAVMFDHSDNHPMWAEHISCWGDQVVAFELYRLGLTCALATLTPLTPLGLAVRRHLENRDA